MLHLRSHFRSQWFTRALVGVFAFLSVTAFNACSKSGGVNTNGDNGPAIPAPEKPTGSQTAIANFRGAQVTGVTVSDDGRIFANFPRWREGVVNSVVEVNTDGSYRPYPDEEWNLWTGQPQANHFTCVQSVVANGGSLFVLDPASPMLKGVVGRPTLYEFDLAKNELIRKFEFPIEVAPNLSYLNDLRIDSDKRFAYMTESGLGAIIVLDLNTGKSRRLLANHPSTKAEPVVLKTNGKPFVKANGLPQKFHADGIEIDNDYLYYHAVTGYHLYRVPLADLINEGLSEKALASKVEDLGVTPAPDGMIHDSQGNLIMADLEKNAIVYRTHSGELRTLFRDTGVHWPDTFAIDRVNNTLIFTDSLLDAAIPGQPADQLTFSIYRIELPSTK